MASFFDEYPTGPDMDTTPPAPVPDPPAGIKVIPPTIYRSRPFSVPCWVPDSPVVSEDTSHDDDFLHDLRKAVCKSIPGILTILTKAGVDFILKTHHGRKDHRV